MSKLYFYYGTMGAAKTVEALICKYRYESINKNVLLLKSKDSTRDGLYVKSRLGIKAEAVIVEDFLNRFDYKDILKTIDVIIVDEVQFCKAEIIDQLANIVDDFDIPVICYGLKTDYNTKLFDGSKRLLEIADSIVEIKNVCDCGNKAIFNIRLSGDDINGVYKSLCRKCAKRIKIK